MMRLRICHLLICLPVVAQTAVSPVPFTESRQSVRAFSSSGEITLPTVRLQVDVPNPSRKERGDLLVIYDPQTGLYLWRYRTFNSPSDTYSSLEALTAAREALYVEKDRIVTFLTGWPWVGEHRDRAASLDAAKEAAFGWLQGRHPTLSKGGGKAGPLPLDLAKGSIFRSIPREFACGMELRRSDCPGADNTQIVSVSKQGELWRLVLRNHWDQELILDSKFNAVSTRQLTLPE